MSIKLKFSGTTKGGVKLKKKLYGHPCCQTTHLQLRKE